MLRSSNWNRTLGFQPIDRSSSLLRSTNTKKMKKKIIKLPTGITTSMRKKNGVVRIEIVNSHNHKENYKDVFISLVFLWLTIVLTVVTYSLIVNHDLYTILFVSPIYTTLMIIYIKLIKYLILIPKTKHGF